MTLLVEAAGLTRAFPLPRRRLLDPRRNVLALSDVSLRIVAGQSFGVVGESGSGKSTLARIVMALDRPDRGRVRFDGQDLFALPRSALQRLRRRFQMVFQDPYGSLDPRLTVGRSIAEPLQAIGELDGRAQRARVVEALESVGLDPGSAGRYPHEFSGGQRQRIAIARALASRPDLIVADEPVSALDVSVQAQVLNLFLDLRESRRLTYLFISHDLAVMRYVTREIAVMFQGSVVEQGLTAEVMARPAHPYTQALMAAVPLPDPRRRRRGAQPPAPLNLGVEGGCPYASRCPLAQARCLAERPELRDLGSGHKAACHFA